MPMSSRPTGRTRGSRSLCVLPNQRRQLSCGKPSRILPGFLATHPRAGVEVLIGYQLRDIVRLLGDWTPPCPDTFSNYPSRRQVPPTRAALIAALRGGRSRVRPTRAGSGLDGPPLVIVLSLTYGPCRQTGAPAGFDPEQQRGPRVEEGMQS